MQMPIIVSNRGDTEIFRSVEELQGYIEAQDVLDDQYLAYDSEGYILSLSVKAGIVIVQDTAPRTNDASNLQRILLRYLAAVEIPLNWLNQATLEQLVEKRMAFEQQFYQKDYKESLKRIRSATKIVVVILSVSAIFYLFRIPIGICRILVAIACLIIVVNLPDLVNVLYLHRKHQDKE